MINKTTMEYYSAIKKNETVPSAATWMIIILSEITQKEKYCMIPLTCRIEIDSQTQKQMYGYQRGKGDMRRIGVWD